MDARPEPTNCEPLLRAVPPTADQDLESQATPSGRFQAPQWVWPLHACVAVIRRLCWRCPESHRSDAPGRPEIKVTHDNPRQLEIKVRSCLVIRAEGYRAATACVDFSRDTTLTSCTTGRVSGESPRQQAEVLDGNCPLHPTGVGDRTLKLLRVRLPILGLPAPVFYL
jgi:hypothetical protein